MTDETVLYTALMTVTAAGTGDPVAEARVFGDAEFCAAVIRAAADAFEESKQRGVPTGDSNAGIQEYGRSGGNPRRERQKDQGT